MTAGRDKKTPTSGGWGQVPPQCRWHLPPRKAPQSKTKQVSWLAAHAYSLRLPKVSDLSGHRRFRSAHSCGAAMVSHHLPCSQGRAVRQLGFLRPVNCSRTILESLVCCQEKLCCARAHAPTGSWRCRGTSLPNGSGRVLCQSSRVDMRLVHPPYIPPRKSLRHPAHAPKSACFLLASWLWPCLRLCAIQAPRGNTGCHHARG